MNNNAHYVRHFVTHFEIFSPPQSFRGSEGSNVLCPRLFQLQGLLCSPILPYFPVSNSSVANICSLYPTVVGSMFPLFRLLESLSIYESQARMSKCIEIHELMNKFIEPIISWIRKNRCYVFAWSGTWYIKPFVHRSSGTGWVGCQPQSATHFNP